ncbi:amidophosphoribosyltransferase [Christensenellaceae bacterium OttesenSCG-928-K19]|nr:amidophosphoribosyltransferase [Christensenellaceae bacterium OttesenSCG-928-K19]
MGGIFGVTSKENSVYDLFFGTDYHSHLGTYRGGMAVYADGKFQRAIHNIQNSPFRTKFERDVEEMNGQLGIGCISDTAPQPLTMRCHLGTFAITTVGRINNSQELIQHCYDNGLAQFSEMSNGKINPTELVAALVGSQDSLPAGIRYAQEMIDGSMTMMVLTPSGIYAARDRMGRTPLVIGKKDGAYCAASESFAYLNLGYEHYKETGPGEIVLLTPDSAETVQPPGKDMRVCGFLWTYYGYPTTQYEGVNVEEMRYSSGAMLAARDSVQADYVAGVPDSGTAYAIGYANKSGIPFSRPFIKYTPTWPRSFMPPNQKMRNLIAHMKLIPVDTLIRGKRLLMIDDSIVRGTQMRETAEFLYQSGAKEVHVRSACPPILFGCKYLNFSRSTSDLDLIARRVIQKREGEVSAQRLQEYAQPESTCYKELTADIQKELGFTTLRYHRLDDLKASVGIDPCKMCTYCWDGKE